MPAGKPGDHPVTDVLVHGSVVFGQPIDALVGRLDERGLWASGIAWEWFYERYWDYRESQQRGDQAQVRSRTGCAQGSRTLDQRCPT